MFNLYITSADGRERKALNSPYPDRESIRRTVLTVLGSWKGRGPVADEVVRAPLGEMVIHTRSGITFRTEEAQD